MEENPKLINSNTNSAVIINNTAFCIGRSLACDHIIENIEISRSHCIIKKENKKWFLYDRSSNGTSVNSKLYRFNESVELKNGDVINLGRSNYSFVFSWRESRKTQEPVCSSSEFPDDDVSIEEAASMLVEGLEDPGVEIEVSTTAEPDQKPKTADSKSGEVQQATSSTEKQSQSDKKKTNDAGNFDIMETELTCSICSELFIKAVTLNCSHTYCKYCIGEWKKTRQTCPICRKKITSIAPTLVLDNFIEKIISTQTGEMRESRQELIKIREEVAVTAASSSNISPSTSHETGSVIDIASDDEFDEDSDNSYLDDYDDYDEDEYVPRRNYYGGYGRCFICNESGHWANGCPYPR